jgi:hypothetical protein
MYSGDKTSLVLTVRNTNSCPAKEISVPTIVLPTGLSSTTQINLSNVTVAGNSSVTFTYEVTANNTTATDIQTEIRLMPNTMTYKCGGTTFFAGGGSSHATIKSSVTGNCALAITELSVTPAAIANGGAVTYVMKVKNTGTNAIVNMNLAPVALSSLLATFTPASTLSISNVNLAVGAEHTITIAGNVTVSPLPAGTQHAHQVLINSGAVTGTCNYGLISNQLPKVATLIING